ncbi:hypothetical protein V5F32_18400 [Xanthobacter oligotrophicus]|uniref:Adenylate cyclase n=1 Tax=Xanthobacter oligotrophicus TaxID=2607286 RepID=A0ABW7A2H7_9HYPH
MEGQQVSPWAVREQVERMEQSALFAGSGRLAVLLRHLVEEALAGNIDALKEAAVGNAVYAREPAYDPRFDSTVRVEARRLRRKLAAYYAERAPQDRVRIDLPTGTYVPTFSWMGNAEASAAPEPMSVEEEQRIFQHGTGAALVILPFTPLSNAPEDTLFADELADELIFAMDKAEGYRIASRRIALQYRDKGTSIAALAQDLGADGVLHGTVRRAGDRLRVTVELADPAGFAVWSDRFEEHAGNPEDLLTLQERIAATILSRIRFDSSRMRSGAAAPKPHAIKASASVYRARRLLDQQTPRALRQALAIFSQVAETTSDYARGYSGIADCTCDLFRLGLIDHATARRDAEAAARKALAIDPRSVEAHTALATIAAWMDWDREAAERAFQMAVGLGENARCVRLHGVFLAFCGRDEEALRLFARARAIEPISTQQECAEALCRFQTRRFASPPAAQVNEAALPAEAQFFRGLALAFSGLNEAALEIAGRLDAAEPDIPVLAFAAAEVRAWAGAPAEASRRLDLPIGAGSPFARATLALSVGRHEAALDALAQALEARELGCVWLRTDPRFDAVRGLPRFAELEGLLPVPVDGRPER